MPTNPSLLIVPYRFKAAKLYSQLPESGAGDFTVTRSTTATRTNASGLLESVASGVPRLDYTGGGCPALLVEPAATNSALHSRDLTNAVWVRTNMNATRDQVGVDGSANTATRLTATAANATILQSLTLASAQREWSAWIRRITGTGRIDMTMDGGASWVIVTSGITSTFSPIDIPAQTLANNSVGFRIADSGDEIAVDFVQLEAGAVRTSPIITGAATATRNADVISLTGASGLIGQQSGTCYFEGEANNINDDIIYINRSVTNSVVLYKDGSNRLLGRIYHPSGSIIFQTAINFTGRFKAAIAYQSGNSAFFVNGTQVGATNTNSFTFNTALGLIEVSKSVAFFAGVKPSSLRAAAIYTSRLSNAELATLTTL